MAGPCWICAAGLIVAGVAGAAFGMEFKAIGCILLLLFFLLLFVWSVCQIAGFCSALEDSRSEIADDQNAWR